MKENEFFHNSLAGNQQKIYQTHFRFDFIYLGLTPLSMNCPVCIYYFQF